MRNQRSETTNQPTREDANRVESGVFRGQIEQVVSSADCRQAYPPTSPQTPESAQTRSTSAETAGKNARPIAQSADPRNGHG